MVVVAVVAVTAAAGTTATVLVRKAQVAEATAVARGAAMVGRKPVVMAAAVTRAARRPGLSMPVRRTGPPRVGIPSYAGHAALASALGALNAAHASLTALSHAAPMSRVGMIAAYDHAMLAALSMPTATPAQIAARNAAIASARQNQLAVAASKGLTPAVVSRVDALLGLPRSNPALGVAPSDVDTANAWR